MGSDEGPPGGFCHRLYVNHPADFLPQAENEGNGEDIFTSTPQQSPLSRTVNRSTWDVRLDTLAAEAMMPLSTLNQRHAQRDRAEISSQISDLKATVEMQGEMIRRMMEMLDGKGKQRATDSEELASVRS